MKLNYEIKLENKIREYSREVSVESQILIELTSPHPPTSKRIKP